MKNRTFCKQPGLKTGLITLFAALAAPPVSAALSEADCRLIQPGDKKLTILPSYPNYFAKPLGRIGNDGGWGAWIGAGGNQITQIDAVLPPGQSAVSIAVPGSIDPVWSPPKSDGTVNWLTNPGMTWYSADEILKKAVRHEDARNVQPVFGDGEQSGVYQSIALLSDQKTYRVVTEQGGSASSCTPVPI